MKRLIILGAVWAAVLAKPELYKEKEDFQFSRSSSDDGTKSGFYGAQRGNMGGNYERAHNMDSLAQNQMGGLVRQVEGELGDAAKSKVGSVYTAANSRGTFGSRHYDLSNLAGRNFQEGTSYDDSHARSSLSSSSAYNAQQSSLAYNAQHADYANSRSQSSIHSGYQTAGHSGLNQQTDDLQSLDNIQGAGLYDYGRQSSHSAGYNSQSGFHQQSVYDSTNTNAHAGGYGSNGQTRLISAQPVRIIVRPGTRVTIPIAAQSYDNTYGSSLIDQNSLASDAEVIGNTNNKRTVYSVPSNAKHYESSYNYRKEWEKHDTIPSTVISPTIPTENPFPKNSELYEDNQARTASDQYDTRRVDSQRVHSSNVYGGFANAHVKSASSQARTNYDTQHGSLLNTNAYTGSGYNTGPNHQGVSLDSSSNSYIQAQHNAGSRYHGAAADSKSLTQAAYNTGFNTDLNSQVEDLNSKPKSYQSSYSYHKSWERQGDPYVIKPASSGYYDGQSTQRLTSSTKNQAYVGTGLHYQHTHQSEADCDENGHIRVARSYNTNQYQEQQRSQNIEDMGQQVEQLGQQVEDFGQQAQTQQDLGQQAQTTWDNLEDLSQQAHTKWDEVHNSWDKFEDLRQKTESDWEQKLKDTTQIENLEQKTQNDLGQQKQQTTIEWGSPHDFDQQEKWDISNIGHHDETPYEQSQQHQLDISKNLEPSQKPKTNKSDQTSVQDKVENFGSYQNASQKEQNVSNNQRDDTSDQASSGSKDLQPCNLGNNIMSQNVNNNPKTQPLSEQSIVNTQPTYKIPDTNEQRNNTYFTLEYYNNHNQSSKHENSLQETHKLNESYNWNSSSHRQEQTTSTHSYHTTFEAIPSYTAPLSTLWEKIGNIEQQSTLSMSNKNVNEENYSSQVYTSTQGSNQNAKSDQKNQTVFTQQYNKNQTKPNYHVNLPDVRPNKLNDTKTDKERPQDLGRGDIGPEDISDSEENKEPTRHPSEITASPAQQKPQDQISQDEKGDLNKNITNIHDENLNQHNLNAFGQNESLQQMPHSFGQEGYLEQQEFQNFDQSQDVQQQISQDFGQQYLQVFGQQSMQDFGQLDSLEQQNAQNVGMTNLHDFGHQNVEQDLQDFGQHQNVEQQNLQDFGHQNVEQQNLQDFGQHQNVEQQNLQDFGQHQNVEQQNLQDFGQHQNVEQQNLQDFGQHQNVEQQNLQNFGQHQNVEQPNLQDFGQHQNVEQQNLQDFGQHETHRQKNLQVFGRSESQDQNNLFFDFGQHDYLEQQNAQNFEQQNLNNFVRPNQQQNVQVFGQVQDQEKEIQQNMDKPENMKQQKLLPSEPDKNLEQQNLQDFGNTENFEQINLQDNGQQSIHDFGQNMQDFEQHDFLEKMSSQKLGQQYLHDFRRLEKKQENQKETSDQQNIQDFRPQNEDQQNYKDNFKFHEPEQRTYQEINSQHENQPHPKEIEESMQVQKQNNELQSNSPQNPNNVAVLPIEPVTEKPGFWKSVGNKLSRAKSKLSSWFQS